MNTAHSSEHAEPRYMLVFFWLFVLTAIEVGIVYAPVPKALIVSGLVILALAKAFLVAWNYMHLRFERRTLILTVALPMLLVVGLFIGLLPDLAQMFF